MVVELDVTEHRMCSARVSVLDNAMSDHMDKDRGHSVNSKGTIVVQAQGHVMGLNNTEVSSIING